MVSAEQLVLQEVEELENGNEMFVVRLPDGPRIYQEQVENIP